MHIQAYICLCIGTPGPNGEVPCKALAGKLCAYSEDIPERPMCRSLLPRAEIFSLGAGLLCCGACVQWTLPDTDTPGPMASNKIFTMQGAQWLKDHVTLSRELVAGNRLVGNHSDEIMGTHHGWGGEENPVLDGAP